VGKSYRRGDKHSRKFDDYDGDSENVDKKHQNRSDRRSVKYILREYEGEPHDGEFHKRS